MSQVRIQVLCGPEAVHPSRMGWSPTTVPSVSAPRPIRRGDWYAWRLIGANNHELGRSALSFLSYQQTLAAFADVQAGLDRLVRQSIHERVSGRWGWRLELDGVAVAASGRWYKRDQDGLVGAAKFVELSAEAELAESVVTLQDRRLLTRGAR